MCNLNIVVTTIAETDMQEIFDYIAQDNISKAIELINIFEEKFKILSMFPNSGYRKSKLLKRNIRELVVAKHYQIIYCVENQNIFVLRVLTGYQDLFFN